MKKNLQDEQIFLHVQTRREKTTRKWRIAAIDHYFKEMQLSYLSHLVNINFSIDSQNGLKMCQHYYAP